MRKVYNDPMNERVSLKVTLTKTEWLNWFLVLIRQPNKSHERYIALEGIRMAILDGDETYIPVAKLEQVKKAATLIKTYKRKRKRDTK